MFRKVMLIVVLLNMLFSSAANAIQVGFVYDDAPKDIEQTMSASMDHSMHAAMDMDAKDVNHACCDGKGQQMCCDGQICVHTLCQCASPSIATQATPDYAIPTLHPAALRIVSVLISRPISPELPPPLV